MQCSLRRTEASTLTVTGNPPHTHQYVLFESHHPLEHKHHQAENVPFKAERKEKEQTHIKRALKTCGNPNWAFIKSTKRHGNKYRQPPALLLSLLVDPPMVLISKYYATLFSSYSQDSQKTSDFDWETQNNRLSKHNMLVTEWFIPKPRKNKLSNAVRSPWTNTKEKPNNFTDVLQNTGEPPLQDRTQLCICTFRKGEIVLRANIFTMTQSCPIHRDNPTRR